MPSASAESGSAAQSSSISAESAESSPGLAAAAESAGSSTALSASSSAQPESTPNDTTGTSAELLAATSSISFPVPDSSDSTSPAGVQRGPMPRRPGWKSEINLFETMLPGGIMGGSGTGLPHPMSDRSMSASQPGFAATFLLPLDTKSGTSNAQTATVLPLQQMIASRALEFNLGLSSSSKTEASGSGTISGNSSTVSSNGSSAESSSASAASSQTSPAPSS
ncbi:hypothetical protein DL89DRAFT_270313 [Linderina pennispora]|uniref:Uncharacterized protein n=1 Tax=Linderina pennispora TaxID=61395 RepID=A0A1Y1VXW8_9FUNG|nr:uncharacterized protein DL89DRAFT_270313 [Linderina pennispora]ORX66119.1 hypothetical protein DL89DRAFT_270313 [Linderina pennispora]